MPIFDITKRSKSCGLPCHARIAPEASCISVLSGFFAPPANGSIDSPNTPGWSALAAASDHLPAVGDYQIVSTPNVRISQTLGGTKVVEGGVYDTYQVVLDTVPTANVSSVASPTSMIVHDSAVRIMSLTCAGKNAIE